MTRFKSTGVIGHFTVAILVLCPVLIGACGTPEANSGLNGVSREEAAEIRSAIRSHTSAPVHSYLRLEDGSIDVSTEGAGIMERSEGSLEVAV